METQLATTQPADIAAIISYNDTQLTLLKSTICRDLSDMEFDLFLQICKRTGLDPFARQIHASKRRTQKNDAWIETMTWQVTIDGFRIIAERTGLYQGQTKTEWCTSDGKWVDVWLQSTPPTAARISVYKAGFIEPLQGIAHWHEYVPIDRFGKITKMWQKMPAHMIAKCAEALALRKAFPQDLAGLYTEEEMMRANLTETITAAAAPQSKYDVVKSYIEKAFALQKTEWIDTLPDRIRSHAELTDVEKEKLQKMYDVEYANYCTQQLAKKLTDDEETSDETN